MIPNRILLLSYEFAPFRGGIARVVEGLAAGAASLGHDVHVLAPDYFADQSASDQIRPFHVHRFRGDFCSITSLDKLTRFAWLCWQTLRRVRPDSLHATDPQAHMALTALSRAGLVKDYSMTVHGTELLRYRQETMPRLWMHRALLRPHAIFAVSNAVRQLLLETLPCDPSRVFVAYPGIDPAWFDTPPADGKATRAHWGIDGGAFVTLTVARRVADKGHLQFIQALSHLPKPVRQAVVYVVVGSGPDAYARQLEDAAVQGEVRLVLAGAREDAETIALADAANLFVMLSKPTRRRLEGLGLAYLECAARGLPSIALRTGGVEEAVCHGETGLVLPLDSSAEQVASEVESLLAAPDRLHKLARAARLHARRFTRENHAREVFSP